MNHVLIGGRYNQALLWFPRLMLEENPVITYIVQLCKICSYNQPESLYRYRLFCEAQLLVLVSCRS